jgi:hypothetical protein
LNPMPRSNFCSSLPRFVNRSSLPRCLLRVKY